MLLDNYLNEYVYRAQKQPFTRAGISVFDLTYCSKYDS